MDWYDEQLVFPEDESFKTYNFSLDTVITHNVPDNFSFFLYNNIHFLNNEEVLLVSFKNIYKTNLKTNESTNIYSFGANNWWYRLDVSIDKKTMLLQKKDHIKYDDCTIHVRSYLSLLDIDGTNERRILIPE